jgi:DNA-binding response OmpR family regulator
VHRVIRRAPAEIEVDGKRIALSEREARVVGVLFDHANQPVKAEVVELRFPAVHRAGSNPPLNKVQLTVSRLRRKIDERVGQKGTGESVIRTRHHRSISTYELYGVITDPLRARE